MPNKEQWWAAQVAVHGSEEAVRAFFRAKSAESKRNPTGKGGFGEVDPSKHKEVSSRGGKARRSKRKGN
jgi:hypothetical protein